jgi:heat shock protein HslJ
MLLRLRRSAMRWLILPAVGWMLACERSQPPPPPAENAPEPPAAVSTVAPSELWGTAWTLEDLAGVPLAEGRQATLAFPEPGKVSGNGSCNRLFGAVEVSGQSISFRALASTRMACAEPIGNQETVYLKALQDAERFEVSGDTLLIYAKDLEKPLRFKKKV